MRKLACVMGVTAVLAGCMSARYQTRSNGRVSPSLRDGRSGYVRDGVFYPGGMFGSGLVNAVAGDPEAEKLARRHRSRSGWGFVAGLGGLLCSEFTLLYSIDERDPDAQDAEVGLALGCAVIGIYGFWLMYDAIPDQIDAINLYNDNAEQRRVAPPAPWPPPPRNPGQIRP